MTSRTHSVDDGMGRDPTPDELRVDGAGLAQQGERTIPTTCIETLNGDLATAIRLSFQIKVF